MPSRLKRPLNRHAAAVADDAFYNNPPEMVRNGERIPLDPSNRRDAAKIQEWRQLYLDNGGETEDSHAMQSDFSEPVQECEKQDHWVEFRYVMKGTGYAAADQETWTLVYPSGVKSEEGVLSGGKVRRGGVPAGMYELKPKCLSGIVWSPERVYAGQPATTEVKSFNIPDGETVEISILREFQLSGNDPVATLSAKFASERASAVWRFEQKAGEAPHGRFVAVAKWASKSARSDALTVDHYPISDDRGLQQRLKHLGYYTGAVDGIAGPRTQSAINSFQEKHPPLIVDGIAGRQTRARLERDLY